MKKSLKGFTLVEIMIVVAIIGIIIAIAVPAFLRARENSRGRACQENLAKIDGAKEQYALEQKVGNNAGVSMDDLITPPGTTGSGEGYLKKTPVCPAGGSYTVNNVGVNPTCSYTSDKTWAEKHELQ
jgi:type II secretion system protein G